MTVPASVPTVEPSADALRDQGGAGVAAMLSAGPDALSEADVRELKTYTYETIGLVSLVFTAAYAIVSGGHLVVLEGATAQVLSLLAGATALFGVALYAAWRRRLFGPRLSDLALTALSVAIIGNSVVHLLLTGEPKQSTNFAILIMVAGLIFISPLYFVGVVIAAGIAWAAAIVAVGAGDAFAHYGFLLWNAALLAGCALMIRRNAYRKLIAARKRDQERQVELEDALQKARLGEAAAKQNRAKNEFLANMSHELRTPLNAIIGFSEMIQSQTFGPVGNGKYLDYAGDIRESGNYLLSMVDDILEFSKLTVSDAAIDASQFDLAEMLAECCRTMGHRARAKGVLLGIDRADGIIMESDEKRVKQIVFALLSNAVKFTAGTGSISVEGQLVDTQTCRIRIKDTGIGMTKEELASAMTPFWQGGSVVTRADSGVGLGLALASEKAQLLGGRIELESTKGLGTVATLFLPLTLSQKGDIADEAA